MFMLNNCYMLITCHNFITFFLHITSGLKSSRGTVKPKARLTAWYPWMKKKWMQVIVVASLGFTSRNPQKSNEFEDLDDFLSQWRNSNLTIFNIV